MSCFLFWFLVIWQETINEVFWFDNEFVFANGTFILDGENVGGVVNPIHKETMAALQKVIDGYIKKRQLIIGKEKATAQQMASALNNVSAAVIADKSHSK